MYIQTIGTRHVNSTYSKCITSHIPISLLVGSLPLAHNAEHFTSNYMRTIRSRVARLSCLVHHVAKKALSESQRDSTS